MTQFAIFPLHGISKGVARQIAKLVESNPGQLSVLEYTAIAEEVMKKPCNLLIFGVGRDSGMWLDLNQGGMTVFFEDNPEWLEIATQSIPKIHAYLVQYHTKRGQWEKRLRNPRTLRFILPDIVKKTEWDIIFVDGPAGYSDEVPGRMKSIYTASRLAKKSSECSVFVHDCDRVLESVYCDRFLQNKNLIFQVDRLRHYKISTSY